MKSEIETSAAKWFARRDAGLTPSEEKDYRRWLAQDPRNAEELAKLEGAWATFGRPTAAGSADALLVELAGRRTRRQRRSRMAMAAVALLLVGFTVMRWPKGGSASVSAPIAVVHRPSERVLADGSKITLREGAEVDVHYTEADRRVLLLKGEALFEVAKDPSRPFIVQGEGVDVRAVGTAFAVQLNKGAVDVLVTEGTVSVATSPATKPAVTESRSEKLANTAVPTPMMVTAGKRVVVDNKVTASPRQPETVAPAEIENRLSWRAPRVEFNGMPLAEAVEMLNREAEGRTPTRLRVADRSLDSMRVSGVFRTDNMDAFVFVLENAFDVKIERADHLVVLKKGS